MQNLGYWLSAQVGLDLLLLGVAALFLFKARGLNQKLASLAAERPVTEKLEELGQKLNAWERRLALLEELTQALGERLTASPFSQAAKVGGPAGPARPLERSGGASLRAQVEDLFRQGFPPEEIARHLGLHLAEVKVALDLSKVRPA